MSINIPFNFQPTSVSVKTSSYTIPAGSYAFVQVQVVDGGTFSIDGNTALTATGSTQGDLNVVSTTTASNSVLLHTVASGYRFEGQAIFNGANDEITVSSGGNPIARSISANETVTFTAGEGQALYSGSSTSSDIYLTGVEIREHKPLTIDQGQFWVPTGTVLNGTGTWQATVSLFNEIT